MKTIRKNSYVIAALGIAIVVSSLGVLDRALHNGHDLLFHLARIAGLRAGIRAGIKGEGQIPVRIQPGWTNGYGYAVSIFYGDILLYVPAILTFFKVSIITAYKIYVVAVNAGTALISYLCFKRISKSKQIGAAVSVIYTLSMYRICDLYIRAAVGEYTAMMFFPVIVLGMWEIVRQDEDGKDYGWIILTLGMSGVIQTHVLSCIMVFLFMMIACMICVKYVFQKKILLQFTKSVCATICLNAFFLIPFLDYRKEELEVFHKLDSYGIQKLGMTVYDLFAWPTKGAGAVGSQYSERIPVTLGSAAVSIVILGIIVLLRNTEWEEHEKAVIRWSLLGVALSAGMTLNSFPWDGLEKIDFLHQLVGTLQFPFRFMAICMILVSLLASLVFAVCERRMKNQDHFKILLLGFCLLCIFQSMVFTDRIMNDVEEYPYPDLVNIHESVYNDLYYYVETNKSRMYESNDMEGSAIIDNWERSDHVFTVTCKTQDEANIVFPLAYYPDYQCIDLETGMVCQTDRGDNNRLCAALPGHYEGTLQVKFKEPWFWRLAEGISLFSAISLLGMIYRKWKRRKNCDFADL